MERSNCLAIDIGNSQIHLGWFEDKKITRRENRPSSTKSMGEVRGWIDEAIRLKNRIGIASVVPDILESLTVGLDKLKYHVLKFSDLPIKYALKNPESVGIDRLVNSARAYMLCKKGVIVASLGTATVIDLVDNNGVYQGGVILPGIQTMLKSLSEHTASLPDIEFIPQNETIGRSTKEAMLLGVQLATKGVVSEFRKIHPGFALILTGGLSEIVADKIQLNGLILPDITLEGIAQFGPMNF